MEYEIGKCYEGLNDYKNAKIFHSKAITINPTSAKFHCYYADVCKSLDDHQSFLNIYERLLI